MNKKSILLWYILFIHVILFIGLFYFVTRSNKTPGVQENMDTTTAPTLTNAPADNSFFGINLSSEGEIIDRFLRSRDRFDAAIGALIDFLTNQGNYDDLIGNLQSLQGQMYSV
jgi:hypothetical protein